MIIIRYSVAAGFDDTCRQWVWAKVTAVRDYERGGYKTKDFDIDEKKAKAIIEGKGLVAVEHNKHGTVYDTPARSFQKMWQGQINIIY